MEHPLHILSVDDDLNLQEVLEVLYGGPHFLDFASTVLESQEKCAANHYDLILLDINLPDGEGTSLLGQLRSEHRFVHLRQTPVVMVSASRELADHSRSQDLGSIAFVTKPFDALELSAAIDIALANAA